MSEARDEEILIERTLSGDGRAFGDLIDRYQRVVYNVALRMVGHEEDARDIAQTVFIKAYENLPSFDRRNRLFSWIYRIALNECLNFRRARRPVDGLTDEVADPARSPAEDAERAQTADIVGQALQCIPEMYREVIVLRHFVHLDYEEIADVIGIEAKTVKSRLHTGRCLLGDVLVKRGLGPR